MMECLPINLDIKCETCSGNEYSEHESGFYVCCSCGTVNTIRHGMDLDYDDINKGKFIIRKKIVDAEEDDVDMLKYEDTHTMVNTCANSEFGDSTTTYRSKKSVKNNLHSKSLMEVLIDYQKLFVNLFKGLFSSLFEDMAGNPGKPNDNIIQIVKDHWKELINEEYSLQFKQSNSRQLKNRGKMVRSRRNTEEDQYEPGFRRRKKHSIRDQLKIRKVKNYNIENIEEYKSKNLNNKDMANLFIEVYDQVTVHMLSETEFMESEKIKPSEVTLFRNILKYAKYKNISLNENSNHEETIQKIFSHCGLNLMTVFKESNFDESKSSLTPDYFLSIFYSIFNDMNINNQSCLMINDLLNLFRRFELNIFNNSEIKFLKYINKDKLLKLLESSKKTFMTDRHRIMQLIRYITEDLLIMPKFFTNFCYKIFIHCEEKFQKKMNHVNNFENFVLGVIIYSIKLFYGLNDLPYMIDLYKLKSKFEFLDFELFSKFAEKDSLYELYKQLPTLLQLLINIQIKIKQKNDEIILWDSIDFKQNFSDLYIKKFIDYNENFYSNKENNFTIRNISALELDSNLNFNENSKLNVNSNVKVKFSDKFMNKLINKKKYSRQIKTFLNEEIEFYKKTKKNCNIPLPCDNYLKFDKKSLKFEGITPPLSELMIMLFFSKLFHVEYRVLKKCFKIVEKSIEELYCK